MATVGGAAYRTETGGFRRVDKKGEYPNFRRIIETADGQILLNNTQSLYLYEPDGDSLRLVVPDYGAFGIPSETWVGDRLYANAGGSRLRIYDSRTFALLDTIPLPFTTYHICNAGNGEIWMSGVGNLRIYDTRSREWKPLPQSVRSEPRITGGDVDIIFPVDDNTLLLNVIGKGLFCWQRNIDRVLFQDDPGFPFDVPAAEIWTVFRDSRQNLWFGTTDQGYTTSYHYRDGFNSNKIGRASCRERVYACV